MRDFFANFRVDQCRNLKNETCRDKKPNCIVIFYLSFSSLPNSDDFHEYYKYSLIKFKPLIKEKETVRGGLENANEKIMQL